MLNNIKIEPLNPSSSHIVHKKNTIMPSRSMCTYLGKYLHIQACATLININKGGQNKETMERRANYTLPIVFFG